MTAQPMSPLKSALEILRDSCLIAAGVALIFAVASYNMETFDILRIFVEALIYTTPIMFLAYAIFPRMEPLVGNRGNAFRWTVFVVVMVAISAVGSLLGSLIVFASNLEPGVFFVEIFEVSFKACAVISLVIGVNKAAFHRLQGQLEDTKLRLRTEELERERALKLATEARLGALEARLHPHFLFNTLNSISSLIPTQPERAERLVERMAALLRSSLDSHKGGLVPVEQEFKIVRDYLEIEQARLGDRLRYGLETAGDMEGIQLPQLSVQTLVENSIKFAVAPNRAGGEIRVRAERNNGCLRVNVADTGTGFTLESAPLNHGLDNLRGRLAVLFGDAAGLSVSRSEGWTIVTMKVPV